MSVAGGAVDRDHVALAHDGVADRQRARRLVDLRALDAGHAGLAHAARHDGRVRGHAAVRGHDALGLDQAVDVVGRRLPAHEHDRLAGGAAPRGGVGVEDGGADGRARRGVRGRARAARPRRTRRGAGAAAGRAAPGRCAARPRPA